MPDINTRIDNAVARRKQAAKEHLTARLTNFNKPEASFTRIPGDVLSDDIIVRHMDGTITSFGSGAAYEIFKRGLISTNYTLYDEVHGRWVVGSVDQLDGWEEKEALVSAEG